MSLMTVTTTMQKPTNFDISAKVIQTDKVFNKSDRNVKNGRPKASVFSLVNHYYLPRP